MSQTQALAWLVTVLLTVPLDTAALPAVAPWRRRSARALLLHGGTATWLFLLFLGLFGRAWFSMVCSVGLLGLLVVVNNAKYQALREPVVFSDLALFAQSIRHPRLYFPYLSWMLLLAVLPALAVLGLTFWWDAARGGLAGPALWLLWAGLFALQCGLAHGMALQLQPTPDQARHGFLAVFVAYLLNGLNPRALRAVQAQLGASPYAQIQVHTERKTRPDVASANASASANAKANPADMPDVVVVQSESFFDVRKMGLQLQPDLLAHFDALKATGLACGELAVPAWGANTMRTEHAFLSGVANADLGYARFYPYAFVRKPVPALPHAFQARQYACTAVHPYAAEFFYRNKVFPRLGFDAFVDAARFAQATRVGPYVSDAAVTDYLIEQLQTPSDTPQFLFAITMENHGPLHLEKATAAEAATLYQLPNGQAINDLTVYVRHLANANQMLGRLQRFLAQRQRKTLLCFYGDHVPGMGAVYDALNAQPHNSDYLIWANYTPATAAGAQPLHAVLTPQALGVALARRAGVLATAD